MHLQIENKIFRILLAIWSQIETYVLAWLKIKLLTPPGNENRMVHFDLTSPLEGFVFPLEIILAFVMLEYIQVIVQFGRQQDSQLQHPAAIFHIL